MRLLVALASDILSSVPGSVFDDAFWDEISLVANIRTDARLVSKEVLIRESLGSVEKYFD